MKRYLVFCGDVYYPKGGWKDFKGSTPSVGEAYELILRAGSHGWWHIVDSETGETIKESVTILSL